MSAPHARVNRRQSHGRIASDALRALVLFVEHTLPLCWAGARNSLSPIEADTGGDEPSMLFPISGGVVNFAHSPELFDRVTEGSGRGAGAWPEQSCSHRGMQARRDLQVRNNSMKAPLNTSARGEDSSASVENSDGIDPDYCCRVAVVRRWRILGSAARPLVNSDEDRRQVAFKREKYGSRVRFPSMSAPAPR
jgi:hypothetical protein